MTRTEFRSSIAARLALLFGVVAVVGFCLIALTLNLVMKRELERHQYEQIQSRMEDMRYMLLHSRPPGIAQRANQNGSGRWSRRLVRRIVCRVCTHFFGLCVKRVRVSSVSVDLPLQHRKVRIPTPDVNWDIDEVALRGKRRGLRLTCALRRVHCRKSSYRRW